MTAILRDSRKKHMQNQSPLGIFTKEWGHTTQSGYSKGDKNLAFCKGPLEVFQFVATFAGD